MLVRVRHRPYSMLDLPYHRAHRPDYKPGFKPG